MNLLSKLHRNSILTGPIESYCLVCGCLLHSEEESYAHIQEPLHVDNLTAVPQLTDYNDCVIKCKSGYFCRYCNVILPTIKRVSLHVVESSHQKNRNSQSIIRQAGLILAFDAVVINDRAWNGLDGSTCSVCNEDYDDEEAHRRDTSHVLNLIQTVCEFGETYIYRKVDDELFFCLICNEILPILDKSTHHDSEKHRKLFEKSKLQNTDLQTQTVTETNNNNLKLPVIEAKSDRALTTITEDIKPKPIQNKAQNGSAHDINNARHPTEDNIQKPATLHVNVSKEDQTKNTKTNIKKHETVKETSKEPTPTKNDAGKVPTKKESYLYNTLKANNFIIRTQDGVVCCALCDVKMLEDNIISHTHDSHHKILYAKVIAKKNRGIVNGQSNEPKTATEAKKLAAKEKTAVTDKNDTDLAENKTVNDKSVKSEAAPKAIKETKIETNTAKQTTQEVINEKQDKSIGIKTADIITPVNKEVKENKECINKENTPPDEKNGIPMRTISNLQSQENNKPETVASNTTSKKGIKKAQKKAAKARSEADAINKDISKTDSTVLQNIGSKPIEDITDENGAGHTASNKTEDKPEINLDTDTKIIVNGNHNKEIDKKEINSHTKETMAATVLEPELKTERLLNLLKTASQVDNQDDVVINGKYVLGNLSFVLVVESDDKRKCVACDEVLEVGCVTKHIVTDEHKNNVEECLVVTSLDEEFVRQVNSEAYHCGFCNIVLSNWEEMKDHIDTYEHSEAKLSAEWRLQRYLPHLKNCETREVRSVLETIFRCTKE